MEHAPKTLASPQQRGDAAGRAAATQATADRNLLAQTIAESPRVMAQQEWVTALEQSPRAAAQRRAAEAIRSTMPSSAMVIQRCLDLPSFLASPGYTKPVRKMDQKQLERFQLTRYLAYLRAEFELKQAKKTAGGRDWRAIVEEGFKETDSTVDAARLRDLIMNPWLDKAPEEKKAKAQDDPMANDNNMVVAEPPKSAEEQAKTKARESRTRSAEVLKIIKPLKEDGCYYGGGDNELHVHDVSNNCHLKGPSGAKIRFIFAGKLNEDNLRKARESLIGHAFEAALNAAIDKALIEYGIDLDE